MQGPRAGAADGTDGSARPGGRDPGGLHAGGPDEGERLDVLLVNPALHTLTAIPPLIVYFIFQRWLITGLTMGAVKG